MDKSSDLKEYHGNCHCGLFQFTLNIAPLTGVYTCNCSICSRNGYLWIYPVAEEQLSIKAGEEKALHAYQFAMRGTEHLFCPECGSSVMARRRDAPVNQSLRINARMLEGIDLTKLETKRFSGANIGPEYTPQHSAPLSEEVPAKETELEQYKGNCHCGKYKFSLKIPELKEVRTCNCSICTRNGYMWLWPVADRDLIIESGEGTLQSYVFGEKAMAHHFCPNCGSSVMGKRHDGPPGKQIGINVRMLKDIDLAALEKQKIPGTDVGPKYQPPSIFPTLELGKGEEGLELYNGNCHCGSVKYTVKTKPFNKLKVLSCNCSLCSRNGDLWIYPSKSAVKVDGGYNLTEYVFVAEDSLHSFCKTCGVSVLVKVTDPKEDIVPLNVRTINGIDLDTLEFNYYDGKSAGRQYTV